MCICGRDIVIDVRVSLCVCVFVTFNHFLSRSLAISSVLLNDGVL